MLKHREPSHDPFASFSSSSPDRHFYRSAPRTQPRSSLQTKDVGNADLSFLLSGFYSQLEMARSSSPIRSRPVVGLRPAVATVPKPKAGPIKALALSSGRSSAASKVLTDKRKRRVTEAAQASQQTNVSSAAMLDDNVAEKCPQKPLRVPAIVVRPASPTSIGSISMPLSAGPKTGMATCSKCPASHLTPKCLLSQEVHQLQMEAELIRVKTDTDVILSKYLHLKLSATPLSISTELLHFVASTIWRFGSTEGCQRLLPEFCTDLFRHIITGVFHLLDDLRAPYTTACSTAQMCSALSDELPAYVVHCANGRKESKPSLHFLPGLFSDVLQQELHSLLAKGMSLSNKYNRLALPGTAVARAQQDCARDRTQRTRFHNNLAKQGSAEDAFVGVDVVRFVGELFIAGQFSYKSLDPWLERFLVNTVHPSIPSAWEIECACALLITVGEKIDTAMRSKDKGMPTGSLDPWMQRVNNLVLHGDISDAARDWLSQVQVLRARDWKLATASNASAT